MKKTLIALTISILILNSCSDFNDNNNNSNESSFVGIWKNVKVEIISGKDNSVISTSMVTGCETSNTFEFTSDKKFTFKLYRSLNNNPCELAETPTGIYSYNTILKVLTYKYSDNTIENILVNSITNSELVTVENLDIDYDGDGIIDKEFQYLNKQ